MSLEQVVHDAAFDSDSRVRKAAKKVIAKELHKRAFSLELRARCTAKAHKAYARKLTDIIVSQVRKSRRTKTVAA